MSAQQSVRRTHASVTLVITFLIGILLGVSLSYAYFDATGKNFSSSAVAPAQGVAPAPPATPAPALPAEAPEPARFSADLSSETWPAQHFFLFLDTPVLREETMMMLAELRPAGIALGSGACEDAGQLKGLLKSLRENAPPGAAPLVIFAADPLQHLACLGLEALASPQTLGQMNQPETTQDTAKILGQALHSTGIQLITQPRLDVFHPRFSEKVLEQELFGNTAERVRVHGLAFVAGLLESQVLPIVATFPGLGAAKKQPNGLWRIPLADTPGSPNEQLELRELAELMFPFSEAAVKQAPGFLVGPIAVPALNRDHPKQPATESPKLLQKLIRETWAYTGVLLADLTSQQPGETLSRERLIATLNAGCDAVLLPACSQEAVLTLCEAVKAAAQERRLDPTALEASQKRLFAWRCLAPPEPVRPREAEAGVEKAPAEAQTPSEEEAPLPVKPPALEKAEAPEGMPAMEKKEEEIPAPAPEEMPEIKKEDEVTTPAPEPPSEAGAEEAPQPDSEPLAASAGTHEASDSTEALKAAEESDPEPKAAANENAVIGGAAQEASTPGEASVEAAEEETDQEEETSPAPDEEAAQAVAEEAPSAARESEKEEALPAADAERPDEETPLPPLPKETQRHTVERGDTMNNISRRYHTTVDIVMRLNNISDPNLVKLGQKLKVPKQEGSSE